MKSKAPEPSAELPSHGSDNSIDPGLYSWASRELNRFIASRLRRSGKDSQETDELVSAVFERFWKSRRHLIEKPIPYLIRIAENVLNEFLLRQSRSVVTYDSEMANDAASNLSDSAAWTDTIGDQLASEQQLSRVLAQIPTTYRTVLILRTRDAMPIADIAELMGLSEGTVQTYIQRAIDACRSADWDR